MSSNVLKDEVYSRHRKKSWLRALYKRKCFQCLELVSPTQIPIHSQDQKTTTSYYQPKPSQEASIYHRDTQISTVK